MEQRNERHTGSASAGLFYDISPMSTRVANLRMEDQASTSLPLSTMPSDFSLASPSLPISVKEYQVLS